MYTIGDFLIKISNAYSARKKTVDYPKSKVIIAIGKVLEKEGYINSSKVKTQKTKTGEREVVELVLKYESKMPAISEIKLVSKPSVHHYVDRTHLGRVVAKHGIGILSTSRGIMTNKQAQKEGVGGELICKIF